ncbi:MAG: peptidase dimerization domain-containing protein [Parvibaculaceae bacterium]
MSLRDLLPLLGVLAVSCLCTAMPAVNFTVMKAGDRPNIVPDRASAQADVRILHPEELARLEADVARLARDKLLGCTKVEAVVEPGRPPFPPNPGTDGNYSASVGTVTLDALGPVGGGAHTRGEYIDIDRIGPRIYLLARLMMDAAGK